MLVIVEVLILNENLKGYLKNKKKYNQYFTNEYISILMASNIKFLNNNLKVIKILDPGSGHGALGIKAIEYICNHLKRVEKISIDLYEIDTMLVETLTQNFEKLKEQISFKKIRLEFRIYNVDFLVSNMSRNYDLIIMNPPYMKIKQHTEYSKKLEKENVNTVNTYTSFIKKAIFCLNKNGIIISITPRSFMNGKYHIKFRKWIIDSYSLLKLTSFESRTLFDGVLQEVVISVFKKSKQVNNIELEYIDKVNEIDTSMTVKQELVIDRINGTIRFFKDKHDLAVYKGISKLNSIKDLNIGISTGPVVYFRQSPKLLRRNNYANAIPYIFSEHINNNNMLVSWPK